MLYVMGFVFIMMMIFVVCKMFQFDICKRSLMYMIILFMLDEKFDLKGE